MSFSIVTEETSLEWTETVWGKKNFFKKWKHYSQVKFITEDVVSTFMCGVKITHG